MENVKKFKSSRHSFFKCHFIFILRNLLVKEQRKFLDYIMILQAHVVATRLYYDNFVSEESGVLHH